MRSSNLRRNALLSSAKAFPIALLGGVVSLSALSLTVAHAQDSQVDEVVITARDRAEKAQDVPLPISAISSKTAEREHIENWKDVVQKVPSFTPAVANPRTGANGLRGITGISGGTDGSEGGVGIIVDNVFYTHIGFSWLSQYDVESVQVARGPQGTLLGKNTTIGAVIINTKEPSFEPLTTTETTFGSRRLVEERFTNTGTLVPDTIAYRISGFGEKQDGFIKNLYDPSAPKGQDVNRWGVRGQLLGNFGDLTDRVILEHDASSETNNTWGTFNDGWTKNFDGSPRIIKATGFDPTTGKYVTQSFNSPQTALAYLFPQYASRINASPSADDYTNIGSISTHTSGFSNQADYKLGDYTLTSVSAWRRFDFHPDNSNGDFGINQYSDNVSGYDVNVNQISQELRIASPTGEKFDYTAGMYFLRETVDSNARRLFGSDAVTLVTKNSSNTGIYASDILNGVEADRYGRAGITTFAQFAQGTYHYDEHASLTLGLRNSYEIRNSSDTGYYFGGATLPANLQNVRTDYVINSASVSGTNFYISDIQRTDSVSALINPSYKFNDNITTYLTLARGVKSGAANTDAVPIYNTAASYINSNKAFPVIGYQAAITKPETAYDIELGFKSSWLDNKLIFNANVYLNEVYDFQAKLVNWYSYVDSTGTTNWIANNYLGNIPHVRLAGLEFDGRYSAFDDFWITYSGAYNGAWYVKFPNSALAADAAAVAGAPSTIDLSGKAVPNVTPYSFGLGFNYESHLGAFAGQDWKGYVYGNQFFKSTTVFSLGANETAYVLKQPSYSIFNAGIGFKTPGDKYEVVIWGKNLFDRKAYTGLALSTATALGTVNWVDPLTVGVTFRTKF